LALVIPATENPHVETICITNILSLDSLLRHLLRLFLYTTTLQSLNKHCYVDISLTNKNIYENITLCLSSVCKPFIISMINSINTRTTIR